MSKKILFLNTSKLATLSAILLLAVFCTIGMSFRPVYGEDEAELVMSGPRMSHYHKDATSGCNATPEVNHGVLDYGQATAVTTGGGTVTISSPSGGGTVTSGNNTTSGSNNGDQVVLKWNCGSTATNANNTSEAAHKRVIRFVATADDNHNFKGWSTDGTVAKIKAEGSPYDEEMYISDWNQNNGSHETEANALKLTYYAVFTEKVPVTITMTASEGGVYTFETAGGTPSASGTISGSNGSVSTLNAITLSVTTINDGYKFYGWYTMDGANEVFFSTSSSVTKAFEANATIYAKFVPNTQATFTIKGTDQYFYDLGQACAAAASSSSKIVYPIADGTVPAGNYTIPSGVTLLIPYEGTKLEKLTEPAYTKFDAPSGVTALSCYRKLILLDGANITCNGTICVAGQIASLGGGYPSGYPFGACGVLDMSNGGHIELNSGSYLYAWGFVKGQDMDQGNNTMGVGTITANSGAKVYEDFCGENRGGSACSALADDGISYKSFPFQGYAVQNIEVPVTYKYQSTLQVYTAMYIQGKITKDFPLISSSGSLFLVQNNTSQVKKWYDPTTDLACYALSGTAKLDAISTKIYVTVNSANFNLPISSNMHIILDNCTMTLANPVQILPDAVIEIKANSTATISSNLFLYDVDDWWQGIGAYYFASFKNLTSHKNRGDGTSKANLNDAKLIVDGTLNVTGKLYSTNGGANICGNGGGTITFSSLPTASSIYQCWGAVNGKETYNGVACVKTYSSVTGGKTYIHSVDVNSANLHNEDDSYTKSIASTSFHNVNGRWFAAANMDENTSTHVYDHFVYISDGQPVSGSSGTTTDTKAVYAPDKTGLIAGMKWCNVAQDATCSHIYNATQSLNGTAAANIKYTYPSSSWIQLLQTETPSVFGGSDNNLYAVDGCTVSSLGSVDENCLYSLEGVKKAIVNGQFVALAKNTEDEAWHNTAATTEYYISFAGCIWHSATKYPNEEKAYIVEGDDYIWFDNDWLLVENESGMFFDYNEQNVKRYYEYENGAWVLATPYVRVKDNIETREFFKFDEAVTVASGKKNTIITLLKDVPCMTSTTYSAKNTTCTLDLNGHTVHGACATLLEINASGSTFTITDNSDEKNGRLENIFAQNAVTYGVKLTAADSLNVLAGTIHAENPAQYASNANTTLGVTKLASCGARGIHVAATNTLNISGGRIEVKATRAAYSIFEASSAANNTTVNITGGDIYAEAPYAAYGVYADGKLNVSGNNTITVKINTDMVDAYYAADKAENTYNGDGKGIYLRANGNKDKTQCYFSTLDYTGGTITVTNDRSLSRDLRAYGICFDCSNATTDNRGGAVDGSSAQKAAAKGSVKNAHITIRNGCQYGIGIYVNGSYNAYDQKTHVVKIENCDIDVKGYANNFGIWANAGVNTTNGGCYHGDVQADNCTVMVESTGSTNAYGAWATAAASQICQYKNPTTESEGTVASKYYGEYATAAKLTINGGSYTAKTKSAGAYAVGTTAPRAISQYGSKYSDAAFRTEGGHAKDSATLVINGGTFNATSTTYTARGVSSGGNTTINDATFNVVAGSYYAYGFYAESGKITATNVLVNDTAKGRVSSSDNNAYAYGVYANCAIPTGNGVQNGFGYASEIELNNCTLNVIATTYLNAKGVMVNATSKLHNWAQFKADSTSNKWSTANYNYWKQVFPCTIQGKDSIWMGVAAKATVNNCDFTVKAHTTSAWGAYVSRGLHYSYTTPNTILEQCPGVLNINNTSFEVSTDTKDTSEGIRTYGLVNISGNSSFTVNSATSAAIGLKIYAGTTTLNDNPTFNIKAGTSSAYGAWVLGDTPADKTGTIYDGKLVVNGGTFNVTATTTTAYGVLVDAKARQITNTAAGYYPGTYASMGHAIVNDGTFNVMAKQYGAFGVYVNRAVTDDKLQIFRGVAEINGGDFTVRTKANAKKSNNCDGVLSYGTTTINGGTFDVWAADTTSAAKGLYAYGVYVADGTTTINKNAEDATKPLFNVKAYGTIYSVLVTAGQANATTGLTDNGYVIVNGGTYNDTTTNDASSYGVCVSQPAPRVIASGDYAGTYYSTATATINDGTFNIYSAGTTAVGVYTGRNYISANTSPNTFSNYTYGNATINGGTFNMSATTNAEGIRSHGTTVVNGGTFKPTSRTSTAYGLYVYAGTTTINNTHTPKFEVRAPSTAYGALVGAQPDSKIGLPYDGELTINGGDFDIQTTSGATAYGVNVYANTRKITSTSSGYYQGQYASAGTVTINDGTFYIKAVGKTASAVNMGATVSLAASSAIYVAASATPTCTITGGKFKVFASSAASAVVSTPLAENMPISGGYYNINTNLSKYAVSPKKVITLHESHALYPDPYNYRYSVNEGGTVTWKNGSTTLKTEMYESGETPAYTGDAPTKDADASYTYTHNGWDPAVEEMANADKTYTATFSQTENKYSVSVAAGANGSVSPTSVSEIGCETASGNITATANTGYRFVNWTLPTGVTAANGYSANSNPIRIHATATGKTITANFEARNDINYTVKHWQQNLADDNYTEVTEDQQTLQGTTATATAAEAKSYTGFTAQTFEQGTIAGNSSTVVNIYYNRDKFTITWKDGSETIKTEQWKYGATPAFDYEKPATPQYTYPLTGWSKGGTAYIFPATLPAITADETYTAQYNAVTRSYTIRFVNDDNSTVLQESDVQWGGTPEYKRETPITTKTDGIYAFAGWSPEITTIEGPVTYTAQYNKLTDLVVEEGETLNVGVETAVTTTTVHVAGRVEVAEGKTLTTDDLILEATPSSSGEITGEGTVTTTNAYFHFSQAGGAKFKAKTWYAVAVPWQVNVPANVDGDVYTKVGEGEFVQQKLGKTFDLIYYDGYRRSQGATKAWNYVEDDPAANQVMYPGRAYMIYLTADADVIRFKKNSETLTYTNVDVARYSSDNGNLADWNGIANPAIYKAYLNVGATENRGQIYNPETKGYEWFNMEENQLQVGQPIFVQSAVSGTIVANATTYTTTLAPRRVNGEGSQLARCEVVLAASEGEVSDRIIVRMDEDKEEDKYIVGQDLAKMGVSSVVPQMWIDRYNSKMCIQTAIPTNKQANYPLSLFVPQAGEYQISNLQSQMSNENDMLYLTYDNRIIWNLTYSPYEASLEKGTNTHYGLKLVRTEAPAVTTDMENVQGDNEQCTKVIIHDNVYILRGGEIYIVTGQKAK